MEKSVRKKLFSDKKVNLKSRDVKLNVQDEVVDLLTKAINESDEGTSLLSNMVSDAHKMIDIYKRADDMFIQALDMLEDAASKLHELLGEGNLPSSFDKLFSNLHDEKEQNEILLKSSIHLLEKINDF